MATTGADQVMSDKCKVAPPVRVLIIDQERADLDFCAAVLGGQGFLVQPCQTYEDGLRHLSGERYDFIVVDQGSPHFEGRCVLKQSIEKNRHLPVVVLARCHDMSCYLDAMQLGAVDYLAKPVVASHLLWVVETHLPQTFIRTEQKQLAVAAHHAGSGGLQHVGTWFEH